MKKFGGFTEQQNEALARKMGFDGPMEKYNEYLAATPASAAKLSRYTEKARQLVEGTPAFAKGGYINMEDRPKLNNYNLTKQLVYRPEEQIASLPTDKIDLKSNQSIDRDSGKVKFTETGRVGNIAPTVTASAPKVTGTNLANTTTTLGQATAIANQTNAAQGTLSAGAKAVAATAHPSLNATVQGQLNGLMQQFEGKDPPAWAAGAMRMANTAMADRGLGASSMGADSVYQSAMESALSVAVADAQTYAAFEMKNLDNRQQAAMLNAQSFLQMDLANLDNKQQVVLFKSQSRLSALFNDAAARNATSQFNATSKNQTDQFFASLNSQTQQFNADQKNNMTRFKTEQKVAVSMFNAQQINSTKQFNAQNRLIIDQSNAKWRQTIATTLSAEKNENNRVKAQLATGLTTAAYNNLWQKERDLMAFAFTAEQNSEDRATQIAMSKSAEKGAKQAGKNELWKTAGGFVSEIFDGFF